MQVFLSYSDADREFARQLSFHLSKRGYDVWDPNDELFPGDNWPLKIGEALQESKAMVVLLSPDSMKSEWVRREIEYALGDSNYAGRLVPVLVRPAREIPWILRKVGILRASKDPEAISGQIETALRGGTGMTVAQIRDIARKSARKRGGMTVGELRDAASRR